MTNLKQRKLNACLGYDSNISYLYASFFKNPLVVPMSSSQQNKSKSLLMDYIFTPRGMQNEFNARLNVIYNKRLDNLSDSPTHINIAKGHIVTVFNNFPMLTEEVLRKGFFNLYQLNDLEAGECVDKKEFFYDLVNLAIKARDIGLVKYLLDTRGNIKLVDENDGNLPILKELYSEYKALKLSSIDGYEENKLLCIMGCILWESAKEPQMDYEDDEKSSLEVQKRASMHSASYRIIKPIFKDYFIEMCEDKTRAEELYQRSMQSYKLYRKGVKVFDESNLEEKQKLYGIGSIARYFAIPLIVSSALILTINNFLNFPLTTVLYSTVLVGNILYDALLYKKDLYFASMIEQCAENCIPCLYSYFFEDNSTFIEQGGSNSLVMM